MRELYERALSKAGYQTTLEVDGARGLEPALSDAFDIILLDLMVPNVTGIEILRRLRTEKPDLKAKIIITTNLEQRDDVRADIEKKPMATWSRHLPRASCGHFRRHSLIGTRCGLLDFAPFKG